VAVRIFLTKDAGGKEDRSTQCGSQAFGRVRIANDADRTRALKGKLTPTPFRDPFPRIRSQNKRLVIDEFRRVRGRSRRLGVVSFLRHFKDRDPQLPGGCSIKAYRLPQNTGGLAPDTPIRNATAYVPDARDLRPALLTQVELDTWYQRRGFVMHRNSLVLLC
jgi:hypothetical protein